MKRMIAVLVLITFCLVIPHAAPAADLRADRAWINPAQAGQDASNTTLTGSADDGQDEFGTLGDPDCLGGGFRGSGAPPASQGPTTGSAGWINTVVLILMQLR